MISSYVQQGQHTLRRWAKDPGVHRMARGAVHVLAGFCLSAASLEQRMLPLSMGLVWACRGWRAALVAAGGILGYGIFWAGGCLQGILWTVLALMGVLCIGDRRISRELPLLIPALGMLIVSGAGLGFQLAGRDSTPVALYLLRVVLGGAIPWLFCRWMESRKPVLEWLCWGVFTLGLAQIAPISWLGLGYIAAGFAAVRGAFPCAAAVGLALDLSRITAIPMTAVTVLSFFVRFLPRYPTRLGRLVPGFVGLFLMYACRKWDLYILPGLFLGGIATGFFRQKSKGVLRWGQTGAVQVRLEMAAETLNQTLQLLKDQPERFVDTDALAQRAVGEACAGCSARDRCRDTRRMAQLTGNVLSAPLLNVEELPVRCKKSGRVLAQLRRAQEQLRTIQADRQRQAEYRQAVIQQYAFLSGFLRRLSDRLGDRRAGTESIYTPLVQIYGNRRPENNGDRCLYFPGVENQYYIILCDGMGTGPGAVQEGNRACSLLKQMLSCGFPAEEALESLNSICALRDRAGAVTVDLAQVSLDSGKVTIYKWGSAPSYLLAGGTMEKLGTASAPPGMSAAERCQVRCALTLRKGQTLLLVSDGLEEGDILEDGKKNISPAVLAAELLKHRSGQDDATVVTIQLVSSQT